MTNMNKKQNDFWFPKVCIKQHGEYCNGCGVIPHPEHAKFMPEIPILISKLNINWLMDKKNEKYLQLQVDHIDNNNGNNVIENLQLLCPSCNRWKNPRRSKEVSPRPKTPEMNKNEECEPEWRKWVNEIVISEGGITETRAINGGAERYGLSPETTRKYLLKITSDEGWYGKYKDTIVFKKDIPILEEEDRKKKELEDAQMKKLNEYSQ